MKDKFLNTLLLQMIFVVFQWELTKPFQIGICSNGLIGGPLKCCKNYRRVGANCEECWPGTYGENCRDYCPPGRYGRFCAEICQCSPCDRTQGCLAHTADTFAFTEASEQSGDPGDSPPLWNRSFAMAALSGGCVLCVCIGLIIFYKARKRHVRHNGVLEMKGACANLCARANERLPQQAQKSSKCQSKDLFDNFKSKSNQENEWNVYDQRNAELGPYDTLTLKIRAADRT